MSMRCIWLELVREFSSAVVNFRPSEEADDLNAEGSVDEFAWGALVAKGRIGTLAHSHLPQLAFVYLWHELILAINGHHLPATL